jgi:hypothetical protein
MHMLLVERHLGDYIDLVTLDGICFLGLVMTTRLSTDDIPSLKREQPEDDTNSAFFAYIQVNLFTL